jgi:hypothetical protein
MTRLKTTLLDLDNIVLGEELETRTFMYNVDKEKAFKKLASKQFKNPTLALREIVSNALDSYTGMETEQRVDIQLDMEHFDVKDWGAGFSEEKIDCLRTLGQSDKRGEGGYIGRFGIGFASLFHPDLHVKRVLVDTKLNGSYVRLDFNVQETGVTLKRYRLEGEPEFSTRVRAEFNGIQWNMYDNMETTLRDEAKYMNADVKLNGTDISGKALFAQSRSHMLDLEGEISGRLCYFNKKSEEEKYTQAKVALLSHNIFIRSLNHYDLDPNRYSRKRGFSLPPFFGYINCDDLNVITSRNNFRQDDKYLKFVQDLKRQGRKRFRELCQEVNQTREPELREILYNSFNDNDNRRLLLGYQPGQVTDACAKALASAKIFTCWNRLGAYSLNDFHQVGMNQGHLLTARNADEIELFDLAGYSGPIVRHDDYYGLSFNGFKTYDLNRLYGYGGQMNESFYNELVKLEIIDPEKLQVDVNVLNDNELSTNEQNFLTGLRNILESDRVKEVLSGLGMDTEHTAHIASVTPGGVAACYSSFLNRICINRDNALSAQYIMENEGNTAPFYLPILAHELSHNVLGRHDSPFYSKSSQLSSQLAVALADEMIDGNL